MRLDIWVCSLSFVNTFANSFGVSEPELGGNATGGSIIIIGVWRPNCRKALGKWSHFSQPSSAAVTPVCFEKRSMMFTFRGFSGGMSTLRLRFLEQHDH